MCRTNKCGGSRLAGRVSAAPQAPERPSRPRSPLRASRVAPPPPSAPLRSRARRAANIAAPRVIRSAPGASGSRALRVAASPCGKRRRALGRKGRHMLRSRSPYSLGAVPAALKSRADPALPEDARSAPPGNNRGGAPLADEKRGGRMAERSTEKSEEKAKASVCGRVGGPARHGGHACCGRPSPRQRPAGRHSLRAVCLQPRPQACARPRQAGRKSSLRPPTASAFTARPARNKTAAIFPVIPPSKNC